MRMAARLFLASAALGGLFGPAAADELEASSLPLFAQNLQPKPQDPSIWSGTLCWQRGFRDFGERRQRWLRRRRFHRLRSCIR